MSRDTVLEPAAALQVTVAAFVREQGLRGASLALGVAPATLLSIAIGECVAVGDLADVEDRLLLTGGPCGRLDREGQ
jgi:hypothetical protein